eukprot:355871-Chlamydomonas_euryale.AAC.6
MDSRRRTLRRFRTGDQLRLGSMVKWTPGETMRQKNTENHAATSPCRIDQRRLCPAYPVAPLAGILPARPVSQDGGEGEGGSRLGGRRPSCRRARPEHSPARPCQRRRWCPSRSSIPRRNHVTAAAPCCAARVVGMHALPTAVRMRLPGDRGPAVRGRRRCGPRSGAPTPVAAFPRRSAVPRSAEALAPFWLPCGPCLQFSVWTLAASCWLQSPAMLHAHAGYSK